MPKHEPFLDALRKAGHRITPQRRLICEYLATTAQHPTPSVVYAELAAQHPELSRATVYNTLSVLHNLGVIVQIDLGDDHTHYETNLAPHVNLICRRCQHVIDFEPLEAPDVLLANLRRSSQFLPTTVHIQVLGLCHACQLQEF
jgi:Fur family peroxide stress response transcriptional regulator